MKTRLLFGHDYILRCYPKCIHLVFIKGCQHANSTYKCFCNSTNTVFKSCISYEQFVSWVHQSVFIKCGISRQSSKKAEDWIFFCMSGLEHKQVWVFQHVPLPYVVCNGFSLCALCLCLTWLGVCEHWWHRVESGCFCQLWCWWFWESAMIPRQRSKYYS